MAEWFMTLRPQHIRLFTARYYLFMEGRAPHKYCNNRLCCHKKAER